MASELKILWEGRAPGLDKHRLSVGAFGEPLNLLLTALRRIASQMVGSAVEGDQVQTGRFASTAKNLDIEIVGLEEGSTGVRTELVLREPPPAQITMFGDLLDRATEELLDSIERESKGQWTHASVRNYLRSLPPGVTRQVYELKNSAKPAKTVEIKDVHFTTPPAGFPYLVEIEGNVVGVGFDPGRNEVRVKAEETPSAVTASATPDAVDKALTLRKEKVRAVAVNVSGKRPRLISLNRSTDPHFKFTTEAAEEHIFKRWKELLGRLAK